MKYDNMTKKQLITELKKLRKKAGELEKSKEKPKQTESKPKKSEPGFKNQLKATDIGIYRTSPNGRVLMANPTLALMLGYSSPKELAQRDLKDDSYFVDCSRSDFKKRVEREGKVVGQEVKWLKRDGTILFVRESARVVRDKSGNVLYYEGMVEDITEQKLIEESVKGSLTKVIALLEAIPDVVFVLSSEGLITHYKTKGEGSSSLRGGLVGKNLYDALPADVAEKGMRQIKRAVETGEVQISEYKFDWKGKPREYEVRMIVSGENEVLAVVRDITEQRQMERELNGLRQIIQDKGF